MKLRSLLSPPFTEDVEERRKAGLVHIILLLFIALSIPFFLYKLLLYPDTRAFDAVSFIAVETVALICYVLLRKGRFSYSVYTFFIGLNGIFFWSSYNGAGVFSVTYLIGGIILIVYSSIFLGFRASLVFAIIFAVEGLVLVILQKFGLKSFGYLLSPVGVYIFTLLFVSGLVIAEKMSSDLLHRSLGELKERENGYIRLLKDLNDSKTDLEALNSRLNDIIDFIPDPAFVIDQNGTVISWNRAIEKLTGVNKDEIVGKSEYQYALPFFGERRPILIDLLDLDSNTLDENYKYVKREGGRITAEAFLPMMNNGKGAHLWGIAAPLYDNEGRRSGSIEVIRDISDLKAKEEEIVKVGEQFIKVFDNSPVPIVIFDMASAYSMAASVIEGKGVSGKDYFHTDPVLASRITSMIYISDANRAALRLHGSSGKTEFALRAPAAYASSAFDFIVKIIDESAGGISSDNTVEIQIKTDFGDTRDVSISWEVMQGDSQYFKQVLMTAEDVTVRKQSEYTIRAALQQREVLIQELYHRTKNNMQVISSLLRLKSRGFEDQAVKHMLMEIENKILSIALVHQKLYESRNLSQLDLGEYVRDIANMLRQFPGFIENRVRYELYLQKAIVLIDTAIPCGLILNELITNSLKYAFNGTADAVIRIELIPIEDGIHFIYSDNGKGLDADFDPDKLSSLGFNLMKEMATRQLQAQYSIYSHNGFRCEIKIPNSQYRARV